MANKKTDEIEISLTHFSKNDFEKIADIAKCQPEDVQNLLKGIHLLIKKPQLRLSELAKITQFKEAKVFALLDAIRIHQQQYKNRIYSQTHEQATEKQTISLQKKLIIIIDPNDWPTPEPPPRRKMTPKK